MMNVDTDKNISTAHGLPTMTGSKAWLFGCLVVALVVIQEGSRCEAMGNGLEVRPLAMQCNERTSETIRDLGLDGDFMRGEQGWGYDECQLDGGFASVRNGWVRG